MKERLLLLLAICLPLITEAITVSINQQWNALCGNNNGSAEVIFYSAYPPYDVVWSNGVQLLQTTQNSHLITGLAPGTYTVTVTDSNGEQAGAQVMIATGGTGPELAQLSGAGLHGCNDQCNIGRWIHPEMIHPGLVPPLTFDPPLQTIPDGPPTVYGAITGLCPYETDFGFTVTDAMGCSLQYIAQLEFGSSSPSAMAVVSMVGACAGGNGSVTLDGGISMNDPLAQNWTYRILNANGTVFTNNVYIIPIPGNNITTINGLPAGNYVLQRSFYHHLSPCVDEFPFTIPDLGNACGTITGEVWIDDDADCVKDPNEYVQPGRILEVLPGPHYIHTGANGQYSFTLPNGSFTITQADPEVEQLCPAQASVPFTITNLNTVTVNFGNEGAAQLDLRMIASSGPARPGFEYAIHGHAVNMTHYTSGPVTVTLVFDPALQMGSASPTPSNIIGNTITWQIPPLGPFASQAISSYFLVPVNTPLGTELNSTISLGNTLPESDTGNNAVQLTRIVTGSYDPNDKLVTTSTGASTTKFYIGEDEWLDYTIRFQNTGTDTAFTVVITDTLAMELDMSSFQQGVASHPFSVSFKPDRVVEWRFENILLPDSNVNEPGSHGLVSFQIKPVSTITPGTAITNIANIYFDFNPPVITDPSVLVAAVPPVHVDLRTMLSGPFDPGTGLMNDALRANGSIPLIEPYTGLGYAHVNGGGETTTTEVLARTGSNAIVDWVVIELRNASTPSQVQHTRSALIRRDGHVVDVDGISPVALSASEGNYHVAIRHRNHLGCMRATPIVLQFTPASIDLTTNSTATWGTNARDNINGTMVLWPGNVNFDGSVKYTGMNNDRDPVLVAIGGTVPTNVINGIYSGKDVNMNGTTRYTGTNNDRDIILQTIGGVVPTAVRVEQLP